MNLETKLQPAFFSKAQAVRAVKRAGLKVSDYVFVKEDGLTLVVKKDA